MCWILTEEAKEDLSEYQYCNKDRNTEDYSPKDYYYEDIDEWEALAW